MAVIAYLHDGTSVYDELFLTHLSKENTIFFLTFNRKPRYVPKEVRLVTLREPFIVFSDKKWIEGFRMYLFALLRAIILALYLRLIKPDVVLGCMATKYGFYSTLLKTRPLVLLIWGSDILVAPRRFFLFRFMAKYTLKKADAAILDSKVQKEAAIQLGCDSDKILQFPWFDLAEVRPKISKNEIRERLDWQDNAVVVSTRSHEPIYGVKHLIEAIPDVVEEVNQSRFLIIGGGRLSQKFRERARELGIEEYIMFTGNLSRDDVVTYVSASDIYVSTSLSDGTSASLLEAMALAVPSIVTEIPGNLEWIKDGYNGYLVTINDPKSLSQKLIELLKNKKKRRALGESARKTVEAQVNWRKNMEALNSLILHLTNQKSGG